MHKNVFCIIIFIRCCSTINRERDRLVQICEKKSPGINKDDENKGKDDICKAQEVALFKKVKKNTVDQGCCSLFDEFKCFPRLWQC